MSLHDLFSIAAWYPCPLANRDNHVWVRAFRLECVGERDSHPADRNNSLIRAC
jgi:hypothetical protein